MKNFSEIDDKYKELKRLNLILNKNPYNDKAWFRIGRIYEDFEFNDKAYRAYDFAYSISEVKTYFLYKCNVLFALCNYKKVIKDILLELNAYPEETDYNFTLGLAYHFDNQNDKAESVFKYIINTEPNNYMPYLALAQIYLEEDNHKKALNCVQTSLSINKNNDDSWKLLAAIYYDMGEENKAQRIINKIKTKDNK